MYPKNLTSGLLTFFLLISLNYFSEPSLFSQNINEKLIAALNEPASAIDAAYFKYENRTGSWICAAYDTASRKRYTITKFGKSEEYDFIDVFRAIFDTDGNVYTIASKERGDRIYDYYILKNDKAVSPSYTLIENSWAEKNGLIYFHAEENNKHYLMTYNIKSGSINKGKAYDAIIPVYNPKTNGAKSTKTFSYDVMPDYEIGFTQKGIPYYAAIKRNKTFLVIGEKEQKHYSDIDYWRFLMNENDEPIYAAKNYGKIYSEKGGTFIVKGSNEYKKFDWIMGDIILDKKGEPVYVGQDSVSRYLNRSTIMQGAYEIKTYEGFIDEFAIAPNGSIAYVVSGSADYMNSSSIDFAVNNGREGKKYTGISKIKFTSSSQLLYSATDEGFRTMLISGGKILSGKYDYVPDFGSIKDGSMYYVGNTFDENEKDNYYVFAGGKLNGPYDYILKDEETGEMLYSDEYGNYAFITDYSTGHSYFNNVYINGAKSEVFNEITGLSFVNGKCVYLAGRENIEYPYYFIDEYRLYSDNKPISDVYRSVSIINTGKSGVYTFIAVKDSGVYYVEVK